jgi:uroporphyrinogen decarboxylase
MRAWCGGDHFLEQLDNSVHDVTANPGPRQRDVSPTVWQDEFGVQWDRSLDRDIGNVCNCVIPERDLGRLELPDPRGADRFTGFAERCAAGTGRFIQFSIGFSLFERAWTLRGMENLFIDMLEAPSFVDELLDAICDYNVALVEQAVAYDIDAVYFGDDWGSQRGLLMGRKSWERYLKPRLARQYAAAKRAGKFVAIHSCGKVQEVFPDLIEIGLDCFNPFQPEVMDVFAVKERYRGRLAFYGGISTQQLLPYGSPAEVREKVAELLERLGKSGGYIASPAHAIPGDAPAENIHAMIEVLRNQKPH